MSRTEHEDRNRRGGRNVNPERNSTKEKSRVKRVRCTMLLTPKTTVSIRSIGVGGEHANSDEPQGIGDDSRHGT
jgi:hypothetical protein